jgi:uncharacterized protein YhjY with autotransporter beta-barrel domain
MKCFFEILKGRHLLYFISGVFLLLGFSNAHAEDVLFDCQEASYTDQSGQIIITERCKPANVNLPLKPLTDLASSIYDLLDNSSNLPPTISSTCSPDTLLPIANCLLSSGDTLVGQSPFNFRCSIIAGSSPTAHCELTNTGFETVMTMDCDKDTLKKSGQCTFKLNKQPIIDKMAATNRLGSLTTNENAINDAFWTCLNRIGNTPAIQSQCDKLLLDLMDPEMGSTVADKLIDLFERITPKNTDVSLDMSLAAVNNSVQNIRTRLNQLRNGYTGNSVNLQFFDGQQWLDKGMLLAQNSGTMNDSSPEPTKNMSEYGRLGVFLNGTAIKSRQSANTIEDSHDADTQTMTIGMDYRITDQWIAGGAVNISQSTADYGKNAGDLDSDNISMIVYGSYYLDNWYFDASLNLSNDTYKQERHVDCSSCIPINFVQTYSSEFDGSQTTLSIGTGYQWSKDAWGIIPFIQLNQATLKTDAYDETPSSTGAGSLYALSISEQERDSTSIKIGTNIQYVFATSSGVFIPLISLHAVEELEDNNNLVTGRFVGNIATDATFNLTTNDVDTKYFIIGAGFNFQLKNGNAGFVNIQSTESYDNLDQLQYTAGWRWEI